MTKIYIKPETKTYQVELQLMQPNSPLPKSDDSDKEVKDENEVLGKEFSFSFFEEGDDNE